MPIVFTNLGVSTGTTEQAPDIRNIGDATSYTIPSWDPPDDGVVVLCIFNGNAAGQVFVDSVTGNGDFWTPVADLVFPETEIRAMSIFAAYGADLTTGATVIDYAGQTQINCYVSIFHITGADESGLAEDTPWVIPGTQGFGTGTGVTIDMPAASHADNRGLAFVAHNANEVVSDDANWTKLDDMNGAGPAVGIITTCHETGLQDPEFTWTSNVAYGFIALEVRAAGAPGAPETPTFARPGRRVPKSLFGPEQIDDVDQIYYTCPAGVRALLRHVHISNPDSGPHEFTLAINSVASNGNRILVLAGDNPLPADSYKHWFLQEWLNPGDTLEGFADQSGLLVLRLDGYERPAG